MDSFSLELIVRLADSWIDYKLIDSGNGEKLEQWGEYTLVRPEPQAIWPLQGDESLWKKADAHYFRSNKGGGYWEYNRKIPESWIINYKNLNFKIKPMGFKHTGIFPEQGVNWDWMIDKIEKADRKIEVLNVFAYTGGATIACTSAGASVCHVDASKGMVGMASENLILSKLQNSSVRWITDDVFKFVKREIKRGKKYDAFILDPPSYGRGPNGEVWNIETDLYNLIESIKELFSNNPLFMVVNTYTAGLSGTLLENIMKASLKKSVGGFVSASEIGLKQKYGEITLPGGTTGIWNK